MAREKLKDFLAKKQINASSISYNNEKINEEIVPGYSDLSFDPNSGKNLLDLDNHVNGLLGDYISYIMDESNNVFKIKESNSAAQNHNRGQPVSQIQEGNLQGFKNAYAADPESVLSLNSYSNSGYIENLQEIIDKTSKNSNNHNLLKIDGKELDKSGKTLVDNEIEPENIVVKSINNVLRNNNRFSNVNKKTAFVPKGTDEKDFESNEYEEGSHTNQQSFGSFKKDNPKNHYEKLKKIAISLMYKSTGYDSGDRKNTSRIQDVEEKIKNNDIKGNRFTSKGDYIKIPVEDLRAFNADGAPIDELGNSFITDDNILTLEKGRNSDTFGNTYNSDMMFEGNKELHKIKARLSMIALKSLIDEFYESLTNYKTSLESPDLIINTVKQLNNILTKTRYDHDKCVERGIEIFFESISNSLFDTPNKLNIITSHEYIQAEGHVLSICNSFMKSQLSIYENSNKDDRDIFSSLINNKLIKLLNILAIIGDASLKSTEGLTIREFAELGKQRARDPDNSDGGINNIASRNKKSYRKMSKGQLAWSSNEVPSMYLLPLNIIRASAIMDQGVFSPNPFVGMIGSNIAENTYFGINADKTAARIPQEVVKTLEDKLDSEYVPFYVQDLRTNEIISFHAFLNNLTDTYNTQFSPTTGYGRMDPVQMYNSTTRSISVSFTLISTSKEDFNAMWYKINKITTLFYPQWTQGTKVVDENNPESVFIQPFSQVLGASPLVRLRVGDVIKSNYSKFNLSRVFGIGDPNITPKPDESSLLQKGLRKYPENKVREAAIKALVLAIGSPTQFMNAVNSNDIPLKGQLKTLAKGAFNATKGIVSKFLTNGFVSPAIRSLITNSLIDPNDAEALGNPNGVYGYDANPIVPVKLKANFNTGYRVYKNNRVTDSKVLTKTAIDVQIKKRVNYSNRIMYNILIVDTDSNYLGEELICDHGDLLADPDYLFGSSTLGVGSFFGLLGQLATNPGALLNNGINAALNAAGRAAKIGGNPFTGEEQFLRDAFLANDESKFMTSENNPYVRAYETTMGRGLAGVLSGLQFSWLSEEFTWETDYNSRAPIGVKITFNMAVIHDIPPGIDHAGYNRAPIYNVGDIMKKISGDVYDDYGQLSKSNFIKQKPTKKQGGD